MCSLNHYQTFFFCGSYVHSAHASIKLTISPVVSGFQHSNFIHIPFIQLPVIFYTRSWLKLYPPIVLGIWVSEMKYVNFIDMTDVNGRNGPFHAWVQTVQVQWTHLMRNVLVVCRPHEHQHFPTHHHRLYPTLHQGTSPPCPPWMCSHPSGESLPQQNSSELGWKENTTDKP